MKLAATTALLLGTAATAHDFKSCPGAAGDLAVTSIELNPDPPSTGKNLDVSFTGTPSLGVTAATLTIDIKLHGVAVTSIDFDVCKDLGLTCPLASGVGFTAKASYSLPDVPLPPFLSITVESTFTSGNTPLDCYTLDTKVGSELLGAGQFNGTLTDSDARALFSAWKKQYPQKFIDDGEFRYNVWKTNFETIISHNEKKDQEYQMGMNEFGHLSWREFKKMYVGTGVRPDLASSSDILREDHVVPDNFATNSSVDWSKKGAVTPIKNQGQCGSCWAFSTTGSLEGAYFIKTGQLKSFSEQQLVDCDTKSDQGCNGGLMDNAFAFIKKNKGLCTESSYPYTGVDGSCEKSCTDVAGATVKSFTDVGKTQKAMMSAVAQQPVSIAIEADQSAFQFYKSGVFTAACGTNLDHGVLAVGYGKMGKKKYWKVKNSWGETWGLDGFILLQRGKKQKGGQCGILNSASYPTL